MLGALLMVWQNYSWQNIVDKHVLDQKKFDKIKVDQNRVDKIKVDQNRVDKIKVDKILSWQNKIWQNKELTK